MSFLSFSLLWISCSNFTQSGRKNIYANLYTPSYALYHRHPVALVLLSSKIFAPKLSSCSKHTRYYSDAFVWECTKSPQKGIVLVICSSPAMDLLLQRSFSLALVVDIQGMAGFLFFLPRPQPFSPGPIWFVSRHDLLYLAVISLLLLSLCASAMLSPLLTEHSKGSDCIFYFLLGHSLHYFGSMCNLPICTGFLCKTCYSPRFFTYKS